MVYIILILIFLSILTIILALSNSLMGERAIISNRLNKLGKMNRPTAHDELNLPLYTRIIKPLIDDVNKFISKITPSEIKQKIEKSINQAGNPFGFNVNRWIMFQMVLIAGLPILTLLISFINKAPFGKLFIILVLEVLLGVIGPKFIISKKILERQDDIIKALPDALDLLTVSVEAGLGFDGALAKVVDKMPGQLSNEFSKAIQEMKVGTPRKEALKNMSNRVGVQDLSTFVGSIIQAEQLGVSIGNVLRIQSAQMRQKRRQRAQEKAMKAPVKMLFPMVFFIFPTIFAILLGPVIIRLADNFIK